MSKNNTPTNAATGAETPGAGLNILATTGASAESAAKPDEAPKKGKKDPSNAGEKPQKKGEDEGDDESGVAIQNGWIEIMPLDENGAPTAAARPVTPRTGHALAFDLELASEEIAKLIETIGCGVVIAEGDARGLASRIRDFASHRPKAAAMVRS